MTTGANYSFQEGKHQFGQSFMSFLASGIEEANALYHAEAQCTSDSVVDIGSVALLSLLGRAPATSVGNRQVLEGFFHECCCEKCEYTVEDPVLPRSGKFSTASEFTCCQAVDGAALEFGPKFDLRFAGSKQNGAGS